MWRNFSLLKLDGESTSVVTNARQKLIMLSNDVGQPVNDIYDSFYLPRKSKKPMQILTLFDKHFKPQSNTSVEIYPFQRLQQEDNEKLYQYYAPLRTQALKCEFGNSLDTEKYVCAEKIQFQKARLTLQELLTYRKDSEDTIVKMCSKKKRNMK